MPKSKRDSKTERPARGDRIAQEIKKYEDGQKKIDKVFDKRGGKHGRKMNVNDVGPVMGQVMKEARSDNDFYADPGKSRWKKGAKNSGGKDNRYKTSGSKNTDKGRVPVPEDKPFPAGPAKQTWKGKGK